MIGPEECCQLNLMNLGEWYNLWKSKTSRVRINLNNLYAQTGTIQPTLGKNGNESKLKISVFGLINCDDLSNKSYFLHTSAIQATS